MNLKHVCVIVSKCIGDRIYGDRLVDEKLSSVEDAKALGEKHRAAGQSVVVRPNYNEEDSDGRFFREWRSFDGTPFKECRFAY